MRTPILWVLCLLFASGCVHRADPSAASNFVTRTMMVTMSTGIVIHGEIVSADGDGPVGHAEAFFIDTGLDYERANSAWERMIGTADVSGQLDQRFDYGWCKELSFETLGEEPPDLDQVKEEDRGSVWRDALVDAWDRSARRETFAIEIRKEGFKTHRADFDLAKLPEEKSPYTLDLGVVVLERAPATTEPNR